MERADYERLRWRCIRRALLELDITLTRFLDAGFADLSEAEQAAFVDLVALEDHELWIWSAARRSARATSPISRRWLKRFVSVQ